MMKFSKAILLYLEFASIIIGRNHTVGSTVSLLSIRFVFVSFFFVVTKLDAWEIL